jgi:type I restriction enzyme S subunit
MALTIPVSEIIETSDNYLLAKDETWERVLLGDVATVQNGFAFKSSQFTKGDGVPLIRIRDVGKDMSDTNYDGKYDPIFLIEAGDLLIGMDGDFNCARWQGVPSLLNQRVCRVILTTDIITPKWLDYTLPPYLKAINEVTSSVTVKHLSSQTIKEIPLPLPPLEQQKRIVAEIEKQFSRLDKAVTNLQRVKANLKRYKAAVLKTAVEGKLTEEWRKQNPDVEPASKLLKRILVERRAKWEEAELAKMKAQGKVPKDDRWKKKYQEPICPTKNEMIGLPPGWCWVTIDQVAQYVSSGSRGWAKYYSGDGDLFIRAQNIKYDRLEVKEIVYVDLPDRVEGQRTLIQKDDILITITGANVTKTAIVTKELPKKAYVNQHVALTRPVLDKLAPYLFLWIICPSHGRRTLEAAAYGAGKPGLNLTNIRELTILLPSIKEQIQIVSEVQCLEIAISELVKAVDKNLRLAQHLRQSILQKAFSGKLVHAEPTDEPASMLLECIRSTTKPTKRKKPQS